MKKVKSNYIAVLCSLSMILYTSCSNPTKDHATEANTTSLSDSSRIDSLSADKKQLIDFKFSTAVINLPSPFEVVNDLFVYKAPFKSELLNPSTNSEKYLVSFKKEINFGILGVDLSYINFYNQNQETVAYFNAVQGIAKDLNIENVFNEFADRYKSNADNHDSLVAIVDNIFNQTDAYLKKNDRYLVASNVMAGAIIEVNYLSLNLIKDMPKTPENAKLFEKVYNENSGIFHLISLYEEYTDKDSKALLASMKEYKKGYEGIISAANDLTPEKIEKAVVMIDKLRGNLIK